MLLNQGHSKGGSSQPSALPHVCLCKCFVVPVTTGWALTGIWSAEVTLPDEAQAACVTLGVEGWDPLAGLQNRCWGKLASACWVTGVTETSQSGSVGSWV